MTITMCRSAEKTERRTFLPLKMIRGREVQSGFWKESSCRIPRMSLSRGEIVFGEIFNHLDLRHQIELMRHLSLFTGSQNCFAMENLSSLRIGFRPTVCHLMDLIYPIPIRHIHEIAIAESFIWQKCQKNRITESWVNENTSAVPNDDELTCFTPRDSETSGHVFRHQSQRFFSDSTRKSSPLFCWTQRESKKENNDTFSSWNRLAMQPITNQSTEQWTENRGNRLLLSDKVGSH